MFNPLLRLTEKQIEAYRKHGERFLISQIYLRGIDPFQDEGKIVLLFSKYDNEGAALVHLSALQGDKYAAKVDLERDDHRNRLLGMMNTNSNYILFTDIVKDKKEAERRVKAKYKSNIIRYVNSSSKLKVYASAIKVAQLEISKGELAIVLKFGNQQESVKLDEIEKS